MPNFKISIITVVKDGMPFLKGAVESFDTQTYSNKEQIIVYSESEDETVKYLNNLNSSKIIIKDQYSQNMYGA